MEWKEVTLGDLCEISSSKRIFAKEYQSDGVPFYRGKEIIAKQKGNAISNELFISRNRYEEIKARYGVPQQRELLLTSVGTLGVPYVIKEEEFYFKDGNLTWFRHFNGLDVEYLYYWFLSPYGKNEINTKAIGSTQKALTIDSLSKFDIKIPVNLDDQRRIASILSSLDRKIELNNKINADLEEMAQAIFKNWFVDFEPFKDGKFVDSELGMIPEGWKVGKITDIGCLITDYVSNGSFASLKQNVHLYETKEYAQFIRNTDLKTNTFSVYVDKHSYDFLSKSTLYGNEIIISNVGDVGSVHLCPKLDIPMTLGNNIIMLRPNEKEYNYFLYLWFKYFSGQGLIQGIKGGSAQPKFNKTDFKNLPLLIPSFEIIERSYWIFESMFSILSSNVKENSRLSTLRDTLLPRLMSGELEVPE